MAPVDNGAQSETKDQATSTTAATDPYNVEAAEILASSAQHMPIAQAAPIYEQILSLFPTASKFWKQYAEAHMAVNNDDAIKQIFSRCLLNCLHVPLWRCYIRFIRKVNEKKGAEGQDEIRKAFDFMLGYVGADMASGPVWMEYITFLKSLPAQTAQEESIRNDCDTRQLAKGLISEYQPKYNSARAVYREQKKYVDEIDYNMLAVPPTGSFKEEQQWMAWKRFLMFEKGNPQRIDSASSNKRIIFTHEQCLMYLYHYPDVWYDYATWHAKSGSIDAAIKVFQRALKALPDSETLKYAYAELEESRGAIQPARKIYESLLGDGVSATALAHIQFIRFLRRNEGVEAARKYFLDARKSPDCSYHVFVAYALIAFCLDKDPKIAHNIFEAGLKRFMHEPVYILEYADFLSRLNDEKNIRALFERALSSLPPEESAEVWKRYIQFEQTYGDLASMLKVEQRRKEALSRTGEEGASALESSLQDIVSRYSFMDLWPCSSKDLDHLARQELLAKNISKKAEKSAVCNGPATLDKIPAVLASNSNVFGKVIYPDTSQSVIYDPRQKLEAGIPPSTTASGFKAASNPLSNPTGLAPNVFDEMLKATPPALISFLANLPTVEGPTPNVDIVLSICLQSDLPVGKTGKSGATQNPMSSGPATSDLSGSSRSRPVPSGSSFKTRDRQSGKRKDRDRQEEDETVSAQSQPLPRDVFRIRQIQKSRAGTTSQTGSVSYGSALSGDMSGSTS
ncbi:RNA CLEAVAGE STIMULATION FACTOR [Salix viminalis]|uniref:RNA CLEAVAGE STIMULATION FACTOR n=1 Tax=Salix viminalis TaxID=40686 RepID=A0A9Q0QCF8_SALVM|nr:RNA CLEAVAGE STIMULATION FACTOR [Salix viminalis]